MPDLTTGSEAIATLLRDQDCIIKGLNLAWNMIRLDGAVGSSLFHKKIRMNRWMDGCGRNEVFFISIAYARILNSQTLFKFIFICFCSPPLLYSTLLYSD